ncbi:MAG: hypothetical protein JST33_08460 [Actinobacteria bacterium]|nr:hypothetical protein [Actinomycetota bacterium]
MYTLDVAREGRWWIIDVPELGHRTQARTLGEVDEMGRDIIAGALDLPADAFDIDMRIRKPDDVVAKLQEVAELEHAALDAQARAAFERRSAARALRDVYGLSAIDTARVLGITRARVYQLLEERPRASA